MMEHWRITTQVRLSQETRQEVVQNPAIPGLVNVPKPRRAVESRFQMRVLLKEDLARHGVWTRIIPAIMEIVMFFSAPCTSASRKRDRSRSRDCSRSPQRRQREIRPA